MISTFETPEEQLGHGRLLMLGAASAILFVSVVMSVFAPFPIALAALIYGRKKGYGVSIVGLFLSLLLSKFFMAHSNTWSVFISKSNCIIHN